MSAEQFLKTWHTAVLAKDAELLDTIIADGCTLLSPVVWKPTSDKAYLIHILQGVVQTIDGFEYRHETIDGNLLYLEFTGTVDGKGLLGLDRITLNDEGKMVEIEVLIRPLNTLVEFATRMREHALKFQKPEGVSV